MTNFLTKYFTKKAQINNYPRGFSVGSIPPDFTDSDYLRSYENIGWWHAVVFKIALGLSEVEWTLHDTTDRAKPKEIFEHPLLTFLRLVNPFQTKEEFIGLDTIYMECLGESFWAINFNVGGEPAEAVLPYPNLMSVIPAKAFPYVKGYVYGTGSEAIPLDVNEIIHFKYPNPSNQYRGLGQAKAIGVNLSAERNSDLWVNQFFHNSARPDGVIEFDYNLADEQFDKLKLQWKEQYQGVSKSHKVALLEGGGKYKQIQDSVKDMDFPNLKINNRNIILGVEAMPIGAMGISENVNKANVQAGEYQFAKRIRTLLNWKRAKLQEQLLPKFKDNKNKLLGFREVVPETVEEKVSLAESGIRSSILTIDEARKKRGEDPLGGAIGDCVVVPANMVLIDKEGKVIYQAVQANPLGGNPELPEVDNTKPKSISKQERWKKFEAKTLSQEDDFKDTFKKIFNEEGQEIVKYFEANQKLPDFLDDRKTAEKFKPLIQKTFLSGYEDAL